MLASKHFLCLLPLVLAGTVAWSEPDANRVRERAAEWERAALNRESAAVTQQNEALDYLSRVKELRAEPHAGRAERRKLLAQAGDAAMRAADLEGNAFANYDRASANWVTVAQQFGQIDDEKAKQNAVRMQAQLKARATEAAHRAAVNFEFAAELHGEQQADSPGKSAAASVKAADWRETLAGRQ